MAEATGRGWHAGWWKWPLRRTEFFATIKKISTYQACVYAPRAEHTSDELEYTSTWNIINIFYHESSVAQEL